MKVEIELPELPITRECAYEYTGEWRSPKLGEYCLGLDRKVWGNERARHASRHIIRRIEPPEGYEMLLPGEGKFPGCQFSRGGDKWQALTKKWSMLRGIFYCRPKQPQPRYRPWTMDEVPRDSWVRFKHSESEHNRIISINDGRVLLGGQSWVTFERLLADWTTEDGRPCGVEE